MELIDTLSRLSDRVTQQMSVLKTEEATKNALVMPLINALGYNVFDPQEVIPEFTADVGTKKGEKVDYAIVIDGHPMILIECKTAGSKLSLNNASQLYRYFSVTEARFAVLTNGTDFWFYTDLDAPNKMDEKPFFEFSMTDVTERSVAELKKFSRATFDLENILSNASELKYAKRIKMLIAEEFESPSEELVRLFASRVYSGPLRTSVREQFKVLVQDSFKSYIRDELNARLKNAIEGSVSERPAVERSEPEDPPDGEKESDAGIVTTEDEREAFHMIRAILLRDFEPDRIVMRDTKSYCGVLLDDNNRKPICRLHFNRSQKYLGMFDEHRAENKIPIQRVQEIYGFSESLLRIAHQYDAKHGSAPADATGSENEVGENP